MIVYTRFGAARIGYSNGCSHLGDDGRWCDGHVTAWVRVPQGDVVGVCDEHRAGCTFVGDAEPGDFASYQAASCDDEIEPPVIVQRAT